MDKDVIIIGAGPSGLMMAAQLLRFGIQPIIVDKKSKTTIHSKALGVQSRSLEIYDQMGIIDQAIEEGDMVGFVNFIVKGQKIRSLEMGRMGGDLSHYPFLHILEQSKNEALLEAFIKEKGLNVQWNTEFLDFEQKKEGVNVRLKTPQGEQTIRGAWLIAADGARSPIRHQLKIPFEGHTNESRFYVADAVLDWDMPDGQLNICISTTTLHAFFPMHGTNHFRIVGVVPEQYADQEQLAFENIEEHIKNSADFRLDITSVNWFATYRIHHRVVNQFRVNRCFIIGDAAHIHSPAGGQGMNTGLQDAYNLAWKLALVIQGKAQDKLLDSYHQERTPIAQRLVNTTDRVFEFVVSKNPLTRFIRLNIIPVFFKFLFSFDKTKRLAYKTVSQIGLSYPSSSLSVGHISANKFSSNSPKAGDRLPYFKLNDSHSYALIRDNTFHLFLFKNEKDISTFETTQQTLGQINERFNQLFKIDIIPIDSNVSHLSSLHLGSSSFWLVRPDAYIAYIAKSFDKQHFEKYLKEQLCLF